VSRAISVGPVEAHGPRSYVQALTGGLPVWFESSDIELDPSAEALASALLLPSARQGRRLHLVDGRIGQEWRDNVLRLMAVWREWWKYPVLEPQAALAPGTRPRAGGTALCFTGGLDSFYSLLRGERPDALVFVQGYDIPLDDHLRMSAWSAAMTSVAAETGSRAVRLRSNLRTHPLVAASQWDRAHGGGLAAVGHLLASSFGTLAVASSAPTRYGYPWGSHERTDHLWSSDRLHVVHHGASESRVQKLVAIANEPLAQQHLRVCWANRARDGNCSACDKCVSTMAIIAACGDPSRFVTFDWSERVDRRIARLWSTRFIRTYGELLELPIAPPLRASIVSLLRRNVWPDRVRRAWHNWRG
jgi:hypothetical protein